MDKFLAKIGDHVLKYDKRQFILSHPAGCPNRGASQNNGVTFHGYWVLEEALAKCGVKIAHTACFERIQAIQKEHEQTKCGRSELVEK
jgi:hypothetical protein